MRANQTSGNKFLQLSGFREPTANLRQLRDEMNKQFSILETRVGGFENKLDVFIEQVIENQKENNKLLGYHFTTLWLILSGTGLIAVSYFFMHLK